MTTRPRLSRSIPFWGLITGSAAALGFGAWLTIDKISVMTSTLTDGSATGVEVYAGQAWALLGAVITGAGLVGLVAALALGAARSLVTPAVDVVETITWQDEAEPIEAETAPDVPADAASAPENEVEAPAEQPITR
ncbi:dinucleotide-utilizing enzyme [Microbacterium sp. CIAB417]|uniref:dinucleotide-utilizing enzyme n=1 Tax=Microbacterium sp. CIAB417 TaxID=2860287 RepID=UPI001FAB6E54|nr:dinucleotide-utilizing enzyme [Microbacterium sp. CIAB417]